MTEDHIAGAGTAIEIRASPIGADDEISEAIAIYIAGRCDGLTAEIIGRDAIEPEACGAILCPQRCEVDQRCKATGVTEDHIAGTRIGVGIRVGIKGADDEVSIAIAIHIAG